MITQRLERIVRASLVRALIFASCHLALTGTAVAEEDAFCRTHPLSTGKCEWMFGHLQGTGMGNIRLTLDAKKHPDAPRYYIEAVPEDITFRLYSHFGVALVGKFEVCIMNRDERSLRRPTDAIACVQAAEEPLTVIPAGAPDTEMCKYMACRK